MKIAVLIICLLLLGSCASTPQSRQFRSDGPGSLPAAVELSNTPFYPQTDYQCGPAALATVMMSHGLQTTPEALAEQVYIPQRRGSLQIEITATARRHGMLPYKLRPQLKSLFTEIAAGNPVLVMQNLGFDWYPQWHYAVAVGYDLNSHEIILRSGTSRRWVTPLKVFERSWQRAGFWALVIVPVGQIPASAEVLPYLQTAHAFEETGNADAALQAYAAATRQWPESSISWLTLGNMTMLGEHWQQAVTAFYKASALDPGSIISWNNLAYALHATGCKKQALQALQCALKIMPEDNNLQDSWQELAARPVEPAADSESRSCLPVHCN